MKRLSRSPVAAGVLLALMFAAGAVSAGLLMRSRESPATTVRSDFFESVLDSLDVSADRRAELDSVLSARTAETTAVVQEAIRRLEAMTDTTAAQLRSRLDQDQAVRFDRLVGQERGLGQPRRRREGGG